jgi:tRNA pseudouridine13 synthase
VRLRRVEGDGWGLRLQRLAEIGTPNYFGPQRFGVDNLERARAWLLTRPRRRLTEFRSGLYLSVARGFLFNEVLAARVRDGSWNRLLPGDVEALSPGCWRPVRRRSHGAVVGSGALGDGGARAGHRTLARLEGHRAISATPWSMPARCSSGAVWCCARTTLCWRRDGDQLLIEFSLPPGGYATTLLTTSSSCTYRSGGVSAA